ncbi:MAG: hypothetical protein CMJ64_29345 [Planctomycetaceae bacterium]|nr:hypothetical protein [Planctomycetaceae bacterium]
MSSRSKKETSSVARPPRGRQLDGRGDAPVVAGACRGSQSLVGTIRSAKTRLPNPDAKVSVDLLEGDERAMRLMIEVTWGDVQKGLSRPVRLGAWRYRQKEPQS